MIETQVLHGVMTLVTVNGEVGVSSPSQFNSPTTVLSSGVVAVSCGWSHTCVIMASTGFRCWGYKCAAHGPMLSRCH